MFMMERTMFCLTSLSSFFPRSLGSMTMRRLRATILLRDGMEQYVKSPTPMPMRQMTERGMNEMIFSKSLNRRTPRRFVNESPCGFCVSGFCSFMKGAS